MQQWFAQLSDPHLTTLERARPSALIGKRLLGYISWRRKRRSEHRPEVLQILQKDLQDHPYLQLLITGDLTHIGLPEEFAEAADWLQQLGKPTDIAVIPGNHDACVRVPWAQGLGQWEDYLAADEPQTRPFPSLRIRQGLAFIGLSSGTPTPPLMATGTLGAAQLERLRTLLQETRERGLFRVVYLHHPPKPGVEKWRKRLTDAAQLSALLEQEGAELVIHGHGHRAQQYELAGPLGLIPVIAAPSASALGLHGADIAQYNRYGVTAHAQGWDLELHSRRYNPDQECFEPAETRQWRLARA